MANYEKFNSIFSNFKSRMNFYLNHTLKDENDPLAAKCFSFSNLLKT
jgi:predicted component of type VI protein secretion system